MSATVQLENVYYYKLLEFHLEIKKISRNSKNDATINQVILKTLIQGVSHSRLRHCRWIGRFLVQTPLSARPGLGT